MSNPIAYKDAMKFCRYHLGKQCFAPFTGQDWSGWIAFVYLVEMYSRSDADGRAASLTAMRAILTGVQNREDIHQVFVQVIPAIKDWEDVAKIWPLLGSNWRVGALERYFKTEERYSLDISDFRWHGI